MAGLEMASFSNIWLLKHSSLHFLICCCRTKAAQHGILYQTCLMVMIWDWRGSDSVSSRRSIARAIHASGVFGQTVVNDQVWCSSHQGILGTQLREVRTERKESGRCNLCSKYYMQTILLSERMKDADWTEKRWNGDGLTSSLREPWQLFIARATSVQMSGVVLGGWGKASRCKNNGCAQQSLPPQLCTGPCGRRILNSWWMKQSESSLLEQSLARTAH